MPGCLLPSRNSSARYWNDWNPEDWPSTPRNSMYSLGVSVSSTLHCSVITSWIRFTRAMILKQGSSWSRLMCSSAASSSWTISLIHSSVVWCWMMNSISSWCGGTASGLLR